MATYEVSLLIEQDFIKIINNKTVSSLRRIYDDPKITLQQKMMAAVSLRAAHSLTERDQGEILAAIRKKKWENMNFKDAQDWSEVSSLAYYLSGMKIPASLAKKLAKTDEEKRALIAILSNPVPLHNFQEIVDLNQDSLESIKSSLDLTDMPTIDLARATIALHLSGSIDNLELAHHRSLVEKRTGCHYSKNILFSTAQNRDACSLTASRIWMYSGVSSS
ncbi:hypothetical protein [Austwickia sp. TVS 96-490-7B]|uniref:hypothetical protein n=1 Tax=Austwickia sp. TVS 96-490-7B TaxID=2830843 RepID=UPI001C5967DB|nr:hypothetical protein [Austwickia sp. TVS 96-490-7B]